MVGRVVSGATVDCEVLEEEGGCDAGVGIAAGGGLGAEAYIICGTVWLNEKHEAMKRHEPRQDVHLFDRSSHSVCEATHHRQGLS